MDTLRTARHALATTDERITLQESVTLADALHILARHPDLARALAEGIRWDLDGPSD